MSRLGLIFGFKTRKLNMLLQEDFGVSCFNSLIAGHLGWHMRHRAKFEVRFLGGSIRAGVVVGLLLGLQSCGSLEVLQCARAHHVRF